MAAVIAAAQEPEDKAAGGQLKATVHAGFASIDERSRQAMPRPALFLAIENPTKAAVELAGVELLAPVHLKLAPPPASRSVAAGQKAVVTLPVETTETLQPGSHPLLLKLELVTGAGAARRTDALIVASKVDLAVPGVSDALKLIGIPSLLLLPGALILLTVSWFWPAAAERERRGLPAWSTPSFLVLSVTVSGLVVLLLYPAITAALGARRDLMGSFNLADVTQVWLGSILTGAALAAILRLADGGRALLARRRTLAVTPAAGDLPIELLTKLQAIGLELPLPWVEQDGGGAAVRRFLVDPGSGQWMWLVPRAVPGGSIGEDQLGALDTLKQLSEAEGAGSLAALVTALRGNELAGLGALAWSEPNARPQAKPRGSIAAGARKVGFVDLGSVRLAGGA